MHEIVVEDLAAMHLVEFGKLKKKREKSRKIGEISDGKISFLRSEWAALVPHSHCT